MLDHWIELGFNVPEIVDQKIECIKEPYLVTSFIEGPSLREYLLGNNCSLKEKLELLARFFKEIDHRHKLAINLNDPDITHHDPSTDNVILTKNNFYFIDFETPAQRRRSVLESASIEVAITCMWIVRDLGIESNEHVLKALVEAYDRQESLLKLIVERTCGRPFQFYHRWKNRKRKLAQPDEVTKYDIADGLMHITS